jgi:hypothetical protein
MLTLDRNEAQETIAEMDATLALLRLCKKEDSRTYTMLWRRMMRLEEALNRHPY